MYICTVVRVVGAVGGGQSRMIRVVGVVGFLRERHEAGVDEEG